jgi:hypothetical protein
MPQAQARQHFRRDLDEGGFAVGHAVCSRAGSTDASDISRAGVPCESARANGSAAQSCRYAIVLIATWLVVLRAFLAGVATAERGNGGVVRCPRHHLSARAAPPSDGTAGKRRDRAPLLHLLHLGSPGDRALAAPRWQTCDIRGGRIFSFVFVTGRGAIAVIAGTSAPRERVPIAAIASPAVHA